MAPSTRPAPKSSLAAARATVAPWGLTTAVAAREKASRSNAPVPNGTRPNAPRTNASSLATGRSPATSASRASGTTVSNGGPPKAATMRSAGERRFVAALLATAVGLTIALAATGARASHVRSLARDRMDGTLGRASLAQMEFRAHHQRFALWDELAARGSRLPEELRVVTSNASSSHWFLQVQDERTGLTCSRIGQLLDDPNMPVVPDCESAAR